MKKTAIAVVVGVLAAPAAFAQSTVTLYGLMDINLRHERNTNAGVSSKRTEIEDGAFNGTRWGMRGSEDLGGGLKAIFTLEGGFDLRSGLLGNATATANNGEAAAPSGRIFGRESWVGLTKEGMGTLQLGRQYTFAHLVSNRWQPLSNPNMPSLSVFSTHHRARQDNELSYSNKIGGFGFGVQHAFGGQTGNINGNSSTGAFASYETSQLYVGGYTEDIHNLAGSETRHVRGIGGNFKLDDKWQFFGGYMKRSHEISAQVNKVWTAAMNYSITPSLVFTASHASDKQTGTAAQIGSRKVDFISLDYFLSKRTDVYALVDRNVVDGKFTPPDNMPAAGRQTGLSLGIRHRF